MRFAPVAALVLLAGCLGAATPPADPTAAVALLPTAPGVHEIALMVEGEEATGVFGVPDAPGSRALVVFAHGLGGEHAYVRDVVSDFRDLGAFSIGMDFRGDVGAYKVKAGVEDTLAATFAVLAQHPEIDLTIAYGHSMGGEITGLAVAEAPAGTFDHWIDGAGVTDLAELWTKMPPFRDVIEAETGGEPSEVPDEYAARSPLLRVDDLRDKGLARAYIVHATADPIVTFDHAERMYDALADAGIPVSLYESRVSKGAPLCLDGCEVVPLGVAGHEIGLWFHVMQLVAHRVEGAGDLAEPAVRGTYDGRTMTYEPSDKP